MNNNLDFVNINLMRHKLQSCVAKDCRSNSAQHSECCGLIASENVNWSDGGKFKDACTACVQVLKLVAGHVGFNTVDFSKDMLASFVEPQVALTAEETAAALVLRRLYDKPEEDLYKLLAVHGKLGAEFSGLPFEV